MIISIRGAFVYSYRWGEKGGSPIPPDVAFLGGGKEGRRVEQKQMAATIRMKKLVREHLGWMYFL